MFIVYFLVLLLLQYSPVLKMFAPEQRKTASLWYCSQLKNFLSNKVTLTVDISSNVMWLITLDGWVLMYVDAYCRDWEDSTSHVRFVALRQDVQPVHRYSSESLQILRLQTGTDTATIVSDSLLLLLLLPMLSIQFKRNETFCIAPEALVDKLWLSEFVNAFTAPSTDLRYQSIALRSLVRATIIRSVCAT